MHDAFRKFSFYVSRMIGSGWAFVLLVAVIGLSGHYFSFSDRWKTNVAFVSAVITLAALIFLQRSQNHNDQATHLKLDEIIVSTGGARNELAAIENESGRKMEKLKEEIEE